MSQPTHATRPVRLALPVAGLLVFAGGAHAGIVPDLGIELMVSDGTSTSLASTIDDLGGDLYNATGSFGTAAFSLEWDFNVRPVIDGTPASVGSGFVFQNLSDETLLVEIEIELGIEGSGGAPVTYLGSSGLTLTGIDGLLQTTAGQSLWQPTIDGVPVDALYDDPFFLTFSGQSTASTSDTLSPTAYGPGAFDEIGLTLRYELSPGETLTTTGVLAVIPAPSVLGAFAVVGLAGRRRRRA